LLVSPKTFGVAAAGLGQRTRPPPLCTFFPVEHLARPFQGPVVGEPDLKKDTKEFRLCLPHSLESHAALPGIFHFGSAIPESTLSPTLRPLPSLHLCPYPPKPLSSMLPGYFPTPPLNKKPFSLGPRELLWYLSTGIPSQWSLTPDGGSSTTPYKRVLPFRGKVTMNVPFY